MQRIMVFAMLAAFVFCAPILAQDSKTDVVTKSGGIMVKKVIENGKVVDEDVEVFGDLDDEVCDRIREKLKNLGKGNIKDFSDLFGPGCGIKKFGHGFFFSLDDDDQGLGKHIRKHMKKALKGLKKHAVHLHGIPDAGRLRKKIQEEVKKALKGLKGLDVHVTSPNLKKLDDHIMLFTKKFPGAVRLFKHKEDDEGCTVFRLDTGCDEDVKAKSRIKIQINGKTIIDKDIDTENDSDAPAAGKSTRRYRLQRKSDLGSTRPKARVKVFRERSDAPVKRDDAIEKLQREIKRLQQQLNKLKRDLQPRPASLDRLPSRTHQI